MTVLLVDVANVVGARPDGWGRDRAGATGRLLERRAVAAPALAGPDGTPVTGVVAVVEGRARDVTAPEGIGLRRAGGSGDDVVVAAAAELAGRGTPLLVGTADRGLRARLPSAAAVGGPGWLLERLDEAPERWHTT